MSPIAMYTIRENPLTGLIASIVIICQPIQEMDTFIRKADIRTVNRYLLAYSLFYKMQIAIIIITPKLLN